MSWNSRVAWSEGLFLRQHHLQQNDRFIAHLVSSRSRFASPYPWGFSRLELDAGLAHQSKIGLTAAAGLFQDGTPFELPSADPLPTAIEVPEDAAGMLVWITLPLSAVNGREIDMREANSGSRFVKEIETVVDTASSMHVEEEIEVAHPRVQLEVRKGPKSGFSSLPIARIREIRDKTVIYDETFAPPTLTLSGHPTVKSWLDRVIGWMDTKLQTLARYASDPSAGGGLQTFDYFMLQMLNREINVLKHFAGSQYVHPAELYIELLRIGGELSTFSPDRLVPEYPAYDHDNLEATFNTLLNDIQRLLSLDIGRAVKLDLVERGPNAYMAMVNDRTLFRTATFVIEVSAKKSLSDIQGYFPNLCKVGPTTQMRQIVKDNLPGIDLVHMPTPPRQIRTVSSNVYFYLDKNSRLWPEFSKASGMGFHFAGDWPDLQMDLWAIAEDKR